MLNGKALELLEKCREGQMPKGFTYSDYLELEYMASNTKDANTTINYNLVRQLEKLKIPIRKSGIGWIIL